MAAALEEACGSLEQDTRSLRNLRERLSAGLGRIGGARVLGPAEDGRRLPGVVGITLAGVDHESALVLLDGLSVCVSAGSACAAGSVEESHVLAAMGVDEGEARTFLRLSLDARENDEADVDRAVKALASVAARLRASGPSPTGSNR